MFKMNTLSDLFEQELRDLYDAEKQIVKALPKIIKAVTDERLRETLSLHLDETREQVMRLEHVFKTIGAKARGRHCSGMEGILQEGSDLLKEDGADAVLDAAFIAACQRVEHYEMTAYGTLMAWAKLLGNTEALNLLKTTEQEEKAADQKLSKLAESEVNREAAECETADDGGEDEELVGTTASSRRARKR
jgi:ferritin-like metal-binding protein YciE